ncbi:hypothetical protein ABPG72_018662 [Tetrahymena utriculariae]
MSQSDFKEEQLDSKKSSKQAADKKELVLGINFDPDKQEYDGNYSDSGEESESEQAHTNYDDDMAEDEQLVPEDGLSTKQNNNKKGNGDKKTKKVKKAPAKQASQAKRKPQTLVMNVADTQYPVVKFVGKKIFKWKLCYDAENTDCDITWTDNAVQPEQLGKMQPHQKINHFPGMFVLARKNHLARNLKKMKKQFPDHYKFFPQTWLLPAEYNELRTEFDKISKGKCKTFIVKPEASCQGRGIFLTRNLDDLNSSDHYVVQRYLHKPFLIDGLKFDFRIYVLLAACDPMRIYIFKEGLARLATEEYEVPHRDNLDNLCMHLTNYAINKDNPNFEFNEDENQMDVGHKRSLTSVMELLKNQGHDIQKLWDQIKDIIIKTIISAQPTLSHHYKSCQPDNYMNNMCFEILGFDVFLDAHLKPWLLEINHTPSFTTDTPLDSLIKKNCIRDALTLMNSTVKARNEIVGQRKEQLQKRVLTGKKQKLTAEEKAAEIKKAMQKRDEYESKNLGNYEKVYPLEPDVEDIYIAFQQHSQQLYENWTGANIRRISKKDSSIGGNTIQGTTANNSVKGVPNQQRNSINDKNKPNLPAAKAPIKPVTTTKQVIPKVVQNKTQVPTFSSSSKIRSNENIEGEDGQFKLPKQIKLQSQQTSSNLSASQTGGYSETYQINETPGKFSDNNSGVYQKPPSPFTLGSTGQISSLETRKQYAIPKQISSSLQNEEERQQMVKKYAQFAIDLNSQSSNTISSLNNAQIQKKYENTSQLTQQYNTDINVQQSPYQYIRQQSQQSSIQPSQNLNSTGRPQFQQINMQQYPVKMLPGLVRNGMNNDDYVALTHQKRMQEMNKYSKPLQTSNNNGLYLQPKLFDLNVLTKMIDEEPIRKDQIVRNKQVVYSNISSNNVGNNYEMNSQKLITNNNYYTRRK